MNINRYIIKAVPRLFKAACVGDVIFSDEEDFEDTEPLGFIGNLHKKTKSIEICLFIPMDKKELKIKKSDLLYYEEGYDVLARFKEIRDEK